MTRRNILAVIIGLIIGFVPAYTRLLFYVGKPFLMFFNPIISSLIAEWLYFLILGIAVFVASFPKSYYLIPVVGLPIAIVSALNNYLTLSVWTSTVSVFLSFMVFGSIGYFIAKLISVSFAKPPTLVKSGSN
ncbi:MAG: hypothetical protein Q8R39_04655 [bacterium]|nr:hypothetical protein [bacterium]MDZ4285023.1 hypothetical protein [Patescibacteria group bacterium]